MAVRLLRVTGIVQGVGFRPFIHRIAKENTLNGWILNDSNGVLTEVEGDDADIDKFIQDIREKHPPIAQVDDVIELETDTLEGSYDSFFIKSSVQMEETKTLIPPDSYVCEDCLQELFDVSNHRYRYPFINCTNCGPRYSIIKKMPYDRASTTMKKFIMCSKCNHEYEDIHDRRYHAQPNACPVCGPQLQLINKDGMVVDCEDEIKKCISSLLLDKVVAVKSLGGFHLAVNAKSDEAVKRLRSLKKRDSKPFALMMPNVKTIKKYMEVSVEEEKMLQSPKRPIVLLKKRRDSSLPNSIAPNNPCFGVMLPSAPVHYLLLEDENLDILVMTSANISGNPIVYKNDDAFKKMRPIADYFLINNRDIHVRVDDSIVRYIYNPVNNNQIQTVVRRARGFAPYPIRTSVNLEKIFAFGAELKNTIALSKGNEVYISQHIGDVKNDDVFSALLKCKSHLESLLTIAPDYYVCDLHPSFRSSNYAISQSQVPVIKVQHHHAHMAACMAENLLHNEKTIGIIFDGTGYGEDGTIWGGEYLIGDYKDYKRFGTFKAMQLLGGDKAVKEPVRIAVDILYQVYGSQLRELDLPLVKYLNDVQLNVFSKMSERHINSFETSSMGRLFDGISALLGICYEIEYEGQAAIELEAILDKDFTMLPAFHYDIRQVDGTFVVDYTTMIKQIVNMVQEKANPVVISRRFHSTIIEISKDMTHMMREKYDVNKVVLSGGVFMNEYLLSNMVHILREADFKVFYHERVPTNDGGLSLGQIMIANQKILEMHNG